MREAGHDVKWRPARQKPTRTEADEHERKRICGILRKRPASYWQHGIHLYMDNSKWDLPPTAKGKRYLKMKKVRGHLRTRGEGLKKGYTKPNVKKHRMNTGGTASLCAGIIKGRERIWHYLPSRWCGEAAEDLYRKVVHPALTRAYGKKRSYTVLEENDTTGYKSNRAIRAKAALSIRPIEFPAYSPDLNPCDFALWDEVKARMGKQRAPRGEKRQRLSNAACAARQCPFRSVSSGR